MEEPNRQEITVDDDLDQFHSHIFNNISQWIQDTNSTTHAHIKHMFKHAIHQGINEHTKWSQIKHILNINTYREYYYWI